MPAAPSPAESDDGSLSAWWAHHSHRYVLAGVGGSALAAGATVALAGSGRITLPPDAILLLLGAGATSLSMVTTALRLRLQADWAARPAPPPPAAPTCPACDEPAEAHHAAHAILRQIEVWNVLRRRGSSASFASTMGATPADFIWSSWAPAAHALPVPVVGPVPETAYIAPRDGAPDPFPDQGVPIPLPPSWDLDLAPLPDRFPALSDAPVAFLGPSPVLAPTGRSEDATEVGAGAFARSGGYAGFDLPGPAASVGFGPMPWNGADDASLSWVHREALTPIPPHLRAPATPVAAPPPRPSPGLPRDDGPSVCATCEAPIAAPAAWRKCPDCARPICPTCIVTALVEQDRGWCEQCAEARLDDGWAAAS